MSLMRKERVKGLRGQAMIEFAVILPVLVLVLLMLLYGALMLNAKIVVASAARAGARIAAVDTSNSNVVNAVCNALEAGGLDVSGNPYFKTATGITIKRNNPSGYVTVSVAYSNSSLQGVPISLGSRENITVTSSAVFKIEY